MKSIVFERDGDDRLIIRFKTVGYVIGSNEKVKGVGKDGVYDFYPYFDYAVDKITRDVGKIIMRQREIINNGVVAYFWRGYFSALNVKNVMIRKSDGKSELVFGSHYFLSDEISDKVADGLRYFGRKLADRIGTTGNFRVVPDTGTNLIVGVEDRVWRYSEDNRWGKIKKSEGFDSGIDLSFLLEIIENGEVCDITTNPGVLSLNMNYGGMKVNVVYEDDNCNSICFFFGKKFLSDCVVFISEVMAGVSTYFAIEDVMVYPFYKNESYQKLLWKVKSIFLLAKI